MKSSTGKVPRKTSKPEVRRITNFTLRLDVDLHKKLLERAGRLSLNTYMLQLLEEAMEGAERLKAAEQEAAELSRKNEMLQQALTLTNEAKEVLWDRAYKEGQKQGLTEFKTLIEQTVMEAVRRAFEGKL